MLVRLTIILVIGGGRLLAQEEPVTITRDKADIVVLASPDGSCRNERCPQVSPTYLVKERQCVNDTTLQTMSCLDLVPTSASTTSSISAFIAENGSLMVLDCATNSYGVGTLHANLGMNCKVIRLAVVRGRQNETEIDDSGFSVISSGSDIHINVNGTLPYTHGDYDGEVYRMDINCGTAQHCVFFKLNGTTDLTKDRFGGKVSAEVITSNHCSTFGLPIPLASNGTNNNDTGLGLLGDTTFRYILIGSGGGIGLLLCLIAILCVGIFCLSVKGKTRTESRVAGLRELHTTEEEEHYQLRNPTHSSLANAGETADAATTNNGMEQEQDDDHTYALVEEAQADVEEARQKEIRQAKFQYVSVTFDTFKPTENNAPPPVYEPQPDEEQHKHRLPSFARNYNPSANRAMLARSYELVTPMASSRSGGAGKGSGNNPVTEGELQQEEYDKLVHQERKMTGASQQRNFSISDQVKNKVPPTNYSQLQLKLKSGTQSNPQLDAQELGVKKIKPTIKKRRFVQEAENKLVKTPSYSTVQKPRAPPLPPRMAINGEDLEPKMAEEESHYKVPVSMRVRQEAASLYDHPASLVRVARSCEDIGMSHMFHHQEEVGGALYNHDMATGAVGSSPRAVRSRLSLVHDHDNMDEPLYGNDLASNSVSMDSYIDMTASQISYV